MTYTVGSAVAYSVESELGNPVALKNPWISNRRVNLLSITRDSDIGLGDLSIG